MTYQVQLVGSDVDIYGKIQHLRLPFSSRTESSLSDTRHIAYHSSTCGIAFTLSFRRSSYYRHKTFPLLSRPSLTQPVHVFIANNIS